jgi:hypothetical protein
MLWATRGTCSSNDELANHLNIYLKTEENQETYVNAFSRWIFWSHSNKLENSPVFTSQLQCVTRYSPLILWVLKTQHIQ